MIRNAAFHSFDFDSRFAEIGMKGALAVLQFDEIDHGADLRIDLADLCRVYGRISGVSFEQAFAVAHLVMREVRRD